MEKSKKQEKINEDIKSKSQRTIRLRNRFFFMMYRYSTMVFLTSLLCFISAIIFLIFFLRQPIPPQYIPTLEDGRYIQLEPLSTCKSDQEVQKFMFDAVKKLYRYDYINYAEQIQEATNYFTPAGWNEYLTSFQNSNTLNAVKQNKWVVTSKLNSLPSIIEKKNAGNICVFDLQMPILVSYIGETGQEEKGIVYMRVIRQSVIDNADGLGITKIVFQKENQQNQQNQ